MLIPFHMLSVIAWRNLWRNYRRTLIMLAAIAVGTWAMIWMTAMMRGMTEQMIKDAVDNLLGHVQIHAPGYRDDPSVVNSMPPPSTALRQVLDAPPVAAWAARVRVPAVIASERESLGVTLVGIDPAAERGLSFIADAVKQGRYLESAADHGIVIGAKLAERLETQLGRRVVLMSQDPHNTVVDRGFRIVGVFHAELEATETAYVFAGRSTIQQMLKMGGQVSELSLVTGDFRHVEGVLARVRANAQGLETLPWYAVDPYTGTMLSVMDGFILVWMIVVFLALSFGLVNTLVMAVFERTREFGLVQALGMRPNLILLQVLMESSILLVLGLLAGNLLAWASIEPIKGGIDISVVGEGLEWAGMSTTLYPVVNSGDILLANGIVIVLGLCAALLPALRAARQVPIEAITRP